MSVSRDAIRVLVVDDHEVVRRGVAAALRDEDGIQVVGEAATADEAISAVGAAQPDVVVMDVRLSGSRSGIEATREIRAAYPDTRVLMFSSFADDEGVYASVLAGASGYVLKQTRTDQLARAIRMVRHGASLLDPAVTGAVFEHLRRAVEPSYDDDDRLALLSPQEARVLTGMADGMTNREIARDMHLSEKTVKNYVSDVLGKLEVARRAEAAAYLAGRRRSSRPT